MRQTHLLERLPETVSHLRETVSVSQDFPRKSPLNLPADASKSNFLLAEQRTRICQLTLEGRMSLQAFAELGESFGESASFGDGERDENPQAAANAVTVSLAAAPIAPKEVR